MGNEKESKPKQGSSNSLILVVILLLVLLVLGGGGVAAFMMLSGGEEKAQNQSNNSDAWVEGQEDQTKSKKRSQAIYYKLKPTFMVKIIEKRRNVEKTRYLQVDVAIMARDQAVIDAVELHKPLIKDTLNVILTSSDYQELLTIKGKRKIQVEAKKALNKILLKEEKFSGVKAVLFTNFLVQ